MTLLKPFNSIHPRVEDIDSVVAPPYDVVTVAQAKAFAKDKPNNILHITKPEIDASEDIFQVAKQNLHRMLNDGVLIQDDEPSFYVYQIKTSTDVKTGLVGAASTQAYAANKIKRHEHTRPDKEQGRVQLLENVGAQISPILLSYRRNEVLQTLLATVTEQPSLYQVTHDSVLHSIWQVPADKIEDIEQALSAIPCLYIADGHHRSAAAARYAMTHPEQPWGQYFLSVLFPEDELTILGYHRLIRDLGGLSVDDFIAACRNNFDVEISEQAVIPTNKELKFGLFIQNQWYVLTPKNPLRSDDPIQQLAVSVLHQQLIEPILDIMDPRQDPRIDFVGGQSVANEIEQRVSQSEFVCAFTLPATTIEQIFEISDHNQVTPPKSTWFEPKLLDGFFGFLLK